DRGGGAPGSPADDREPSPDGGGGGPAGRGAAQPDDPRAGGRPPRPEAPGVGAARRPPGRALRRAAPSGRHGPPADRGPRGREPAVRLGPRRPALGARRP